MSDLIKKQYDQLKPLCEALKGLNDLSKKSSFLDTVPSVQKHQNSLPEKLTAEEKYLIKCLFAIGQEQVVSAADEGNYLTKLIHTLKEIEQFYDVLGGVVGYHLTMLRLIWEEQTGYFHAENLTYKKPVGMDISQPTHPVRKAVRKGLESLEKIAEIYPVGGAGDRLNLCDENGPLPAAQLPFMGRTLLENLIRDLQGREHLYAKLFGKQLHVPIVMMTSEEKGNHGHILDILEKNRWFNRPKENYFIFTQPLVPVISIKGDWVMTVPGSLLLKPGGHGVIWKLAKEKGAFEWLQIHKRTKALLRQINNPIAGVDDGLLAFLGVGMDGNKDFGFSSCPRYLNAAEGMDISIEKPVSGGVEYRISNIEYPEFAKNGIQDVPEQAGSPYSIFPANTNILFVSLDAVQEAIKKDPIPGMLINMKTKVSYTDEKGENKEVRVGRLESTMQNIADFIVEKVPRPLSDDECGRLKSFIVYNDRRKTISVTKKSYTPGQPLSETPEGCFYDSQKNFYDLLSSRCNMRMPDFPDEDLHLKAGPPFIVHLHPALGPVWSVISQKIQGGSMAYGAEMQLDTAEVHLVDLHLDGSLLIEADNLLDSRCILKGVSVRNSGIDRTGENAYWKNSVLRTESLTIKLHGNAEFIAENVLLEGSFSFDVPAGHRLTVLEVNGQVEQRLEKISRPSWHWSYAFDNEDHIVLKKIL